MIFSCTFARGILFNIADRTETKKESKKFINWWFNVNGTGTCMMRIQSKYEPGIFTSAKRSSHISMSVQSFCHVSIYDHCKKRPKTLCNNTIVGARNYNLLSAYSSWKLPKPRPLLRRYDPKRANSIQSSASKSSILDRFAQETPIRNHVEDFSLRP